MSYESVKKQLDAAFAPKGTTATAPANSSLNSAPSGSTGYDRVRSILEASLGKPSSGNYTEIVTNYDKWNDYRNALLKAQKTPKGPVMDFSNVGGNALSILPGRGNTPANTTQPWEINAPFKPEEGSGVDLAARKRELEAKKADLKKPFEDFTATSPFAAPIIPGSGTSPVVNNGKGNLDPEAYRFADIDKEIAALDEELAAISAAPLEAGWAKHEARAKEVDDLDAQIKELEAAYSALNSKVMWGKIGRDYTAEDFDSLTKMETDLNALKEKKKSAEKAIEKGEDWEGRKEMIDEYNRLSYEYDQWMLSGGQANPEWANSGEAAAKLLEAIHRMDIIAGNGVRDFNFRDRAASIMESVGKGIGSSAVELAGTVGEAAYNAYLTGEARGDDEMQYDEYGNPVFNMSAEERTAINEQARTPFDDIYNVADSLSESAAADIARAKEGLGAVARGGVDIAQNILEMAFDAGVAAVTHGGSLASMFARVLGSSLGEARREDVDLVRRLGYGLTKASIEVATEKMFDGVAGIYGKGFVSEDIIDALVNRLAHSTTGKAVLHLFASGTGEGLEEMVSAVFDPLAEAWKTGGIGKFDLEEALYSGLIGFIIGCLGGTTSVSSSVSKSNSLNETYAQLGETPTFREEVADRSLASSGAYIGKHDPDAARKHAVVDALLNPTIAPASDGATRGTTATGRAPAGVTALANAANGGNTTIAEKSTAPKSVATAAQGYVQGIIDDTDLDVEEKAQRILSTSYNETAFEELTGIPLDGTEQENLAAVSEWLQNGAGAQEALGDTETPPTYRGKHEAPPRELNNASEEDVEQDAPDLALESRSPVSFSTAEGNEIVYDDDGKPRTRADIIREDEVGEAEALYGKSAAYNDAVDSAIEDVQDDPRNVSQIAEGRGTYAGLSPQERADLLNFLSTELDPDSGYSEAYLPGGGEWYVSDGEVVRAEEGIRGSWRSDGRVGSAPEFVSDEAADYEYTREKKAPTQAEEKTAAEKEGYVGKHQIPMQTQLKKDVADTNAPRASQVRSLTPEQARNEDAKRERARAQKSDSGLAGWMAQRFGMSEQEANSRAAEVERQKKVTRLKDAKSKGYIIHRLLGEPNTRITDPKYVELQKNPAALREFVDGKGQWSGWSAKARLDMLERLFPEANWSLEHTAPGWESNSENGINYPGGKSTATPDVIALLKTPRQQDASDWPANYKTEAIPDIDKLASKANIERANRNNPLLHRGARNGKIDASKQKGAKTNGRTETTLESRAPKANSGKTEGNVPARSERYDRASRSGESGANKTERAGRRNQEKAARDSYGNNAKVRDASSESEKRAVEIASRSGVGNVPTRIVDSETNKFRHGTTHIDEHGNVEYVLLNSYHDAGDVGRDCSAAHEATHVGIAKFFGARWKEGAAFLFDEFKRQHPNLAIFCDFVAADIRTRYRVSPKILSAEFFSYVAGGDVSPILNEEGVIASYDALQKEVRKFLVDLEVVAKNQYAGVGSCSKYNAALSSNPAGVIESRASNSEDGRSNRDMQRQQRANEEEAYRQQRYADTHSIDNAKEGGRMLRDEQKTTAAEEAEAKRLNDSLAAERAYGEAVWDIRNVDANVQEMFYEHDADGKRTMDYGEDNQSEPKPVKNHNARHLTKLSSALADLARGTTTIKEFADIYHNFAEEDTDTAGYFYSKAVDNRLKHCKTLRMSNEGEYSAADRAYISETMTMLEHTVQHALDMRATNTTGVAELKANGDETKNHGLFSKWWMKQMRPDTVFHSWGGYKGAAKSEVAYGLADEAADSTKRKINTQTAAHNYFRDAMSNVKAYRAFARGDTKIKTKIPGLNRSVSMNEALGLLRTLETEGAMDHIIKSAERNDDNRGTMFSSNEKELFSGKNDYGFRNGTRVPLLSENAIKRLNEAYTADSAQRGRAIAGARAKARMELEALASALRAEINADPVASKFDTAITMSMRMLGKEIDSTYMQLYGVRAAKQGKTYWPLSIANNGENNELMANIQSGLKNSRIVQERTGPSGALRIMTATDVMSRYIDAATDFASFAALSDKLELMSKSYRGDTSYKAQVDKSFGKDAAKWLETYAESLNGKHTSRDGLGATIRGHLAQSSLLLNGGVALKQSPSYFDIVGAGIDFDIAMKAWRPLRSAKSWSSGALVDAISGRSSILASRRSGLSDVETGDMTKRARDLSKRIVDRVPSFLTNWIVKTDFRTVSNVLLACQMQVEKDGGVRVGSNEYYDEIARKFEEVVLKTQPQYTEQFRAEYQRSDNEAIRGLAMFRSQQTQNLNQFVNAAGEYHAAKNSGNEAAAKAAKKRMNQVIAGQVTGSVLFGTLSAVARGLLRKDKDFEDKDGNITASSVAARIGLNTLESMAGTVWFGDVIAKVVTDSVTGVLSKVEGSNVKATKEFYNFADNAVGLVDDLLTNTVTFFRGPSLKTAKNFAFSMSQLSGLPVRNVYNMLNSVAITLFDASGKNYGNYLDVIDYCQSRIKMTDKQIASESTAAALRAYGRGRDDAAKTILSTLDYSSKDIVSTVKAAAKKAYIGGELTEAQFKSIMTDYCNISSDEVKKTLAEAGQTIEYNEAKDKNRAGFEAAEMLIKAANDEVRPESDERNKNYYVMDAIIDSMLPASDTDIFVKNNLTKEYRENYNVLRASGMSPKDTAKLLESIDFSKNAYLDKDEMYEYYLTHKDQEKQIEALWNSQGYTAKGTTTWAEYLKTREKNMAYDEFKANNGTEETDELAKAVSSLKSDSTMHIQKPENDYSIMKEIFKFGWDDKGTDAAAKKYLSSTGYGYYNICRTNGYSPKKAAELIKAIDSYDDKPNGELTQKGLYAYYLAHPEDEALVKQLFDSRGTKTDWETYKKKPKK